jgi:hypothetical protein
MVQPWTGVIGGVIALGALAPAGASPAAAQEKLGWKEHHILQGDGSGGWVVKPARYQILHHPEGGWCPGFGVTQMDNGEVVLVGSWEPGDGRAGTYIAFSKNRGATWTEPVNIPDLSGRPTMFADLGSGNLTFMLGERWYSHDYGRTWTEHVPIQPAANGAPFYTEGNPLVERDAQGNATRIAEIGYNFGPDGAWVPEQPTHAFFRWSYDGGRTWTDEVEPQAWRWKETYAGRTYERGVSEGALVRARNGWLVAALRTDMPPRYFAVPHNDHHEGTGVSISKDDGRTWSPVKVLFDAGRHHANLLAMPNGDLVMTMTVRADIRDGKLASYRRGCDAIVSHDNGLTWDLDRRYVLDQFEFYDGKEWFNGECGHLYSTLLDDGSILTVHANYLVKGASLIRWKP